MRPLHEFLKRTFSADAGKPNGSMQRAYCFWAKPGVLERNPARFLHLGKRALDADAQRGRTGDACPQQPSLGVFNARAAASAAAINADKQRTDI
jgi:hypothetical protein